MPFFTVVFYGMLFFFKINIFEELRVSNCLDPDQVRHSVGPDLGPNCLQMLSVVNKEK